MLPPDTASTLIPWGVMVRVMQVYGCFPYKMSATSGPPTFSLPLCLWSVFTFFLKVALLFEGLRTHPQLYESTGLGLIMYAGSTLLMMIFMCLIPVGMGVWSHQLAQLLHDMSRITEVSTPPTYRWYCKPRTQFAMFSGVLCMIFTIISFLDQGFTTLGVVVFTPVSSLVGVGIILPGEVSSMIFGLLGRRLVAAAKATVASISTLLASDGSFKSESGLETALRELRDLDAVIREVELQQEVGTRCFFSIISVSLLMAVLCAVACPYAMLQGVFVNGSSVILMGLSYYIMGRFCHLGQTFVNHVGTI